MAAANSQQVPGDSLGCFKRPPIAGTMQCTWGNDAALTFRYLACRKPWHEQLGHHRLQKRDATIVDNVIAHKEDS